MNDKQTETRHRIPTSQQLVFAPVYVSEAHERATWSVNVALPVDVEAALARYINAEEARVWTTLIHEALYLYRRRFYSDEALAGELRNMLETRMRDMDDGHGIEITPAWRASFMERARQRFERMRELEAQGKLGNLLLPQELYAFIEERIASGECSTPTDVVCAAIPDLIVAREQEAG